MKIKYFIILFLLASLSCNRPLTEEQKASDAVFYKIKKEYTLNEDGSYTFKYYHKLLYNSYFAFHRLYGESFIIYNPEYQTLKVIKSQTKMADGKIVNSPSNAFNEVLPGQAADAPAYNHLREMVVTHVGLEIGSVVELEYELETKPGFMPFFAERVNLFESSPIQDYEIIIRIPDGEKLNHKLLNKPDELDYVKRDAKSKTIYAWKAKNLKAISHEGMQPEGFADYPILTFSTVDLEKAFNYLKNNLTNSFAADNSFTKLLEDKSEGWDKINMLRNHVAINMNLYGIQPQYVGYRFRSPELVWKSNGGNEGEKVILLSAMLKLAGFTAQPALAGYPHILNSKIGYPGCFDRYFVKVEFGGETRYFSVVDDHAKVPGGRNTIGINDDFSTLSYDKKELINLKNSFKGLFVLGNDGVIKGNGELTLNNYDDSKGLLTIDQAITSEKITNKIDTIVYKITVGNTGLKTEKNDNYYSFLLPSCAQGLSSLRFGELPTTRTTNLELPWILKEDYEYTFTLPDGFMVLSPAKGTVVENGLGSYKLKFVSEGNKIIIARSIELNNSLITPENYDEFREIMSFWLDKNLNKVVFKMEY